MRMTATHVLVNHEREEIAPVYCQAGSIFPVPPAPDGLPLAHYSKRIDALPDVASNWLVFINGRRAPDVEVLSADMLFDRVDEMVADELLEIGARAAAAGVTK